MAASCGGSYSTGGSGEDATSTPSPSGDFDGNFAIAEHGTFDEPWASAFIPGTSMLFITEKPGTAKIYDTQNKRLITVSGLPQVDYGGQGGLGDVAFLPSEMSPYRDAIVFTLLIAFLLFRPYGLLRTTREVKL